MNIISFVELLHNKPRITRIEEENFYANIGSLCYKLFDQADKKTKTFAFILNNDKIDYFSQAITDDRFVLKLNEILSNDLTVFWGEPNIEAELESNNPYEYLVKTDLNQYKLWEELNKILPNDISLTEASFPLILFLKVEKIEKEYNINNSFLQSISLENINNIEEFKESILEYFKLIVDNIDVTDASTPIFSDEAVKLIKETTMKIIITEILKFTFKEGLNKLLTVLSFFLK